MECVFISLIFSACNQSSQDAYDISLSDCSPPLSFPYDTHILNSPSVSPQLQLQLSLEV